MKAISTPDAIEQLENATVQHGPHNNRIYLMKLTDPGAPPAPLLDRLDRLSAERGYGKIIAKIPDRLWPTFRNRGYRCEAIVPGYYRGNEACCFAARYYRPGRVDDDMDRIGAVMDVCQQPRPPDETRQQNELPVDFCNPAETVEMGRIFQQVFTSYPFPIHDPAYIEASMKSGVRYAGIKQAGRLVALASLEPDPDYLTAEMGDFATLPHCREKGLANRLLSCLDNLAREMGLRTAYAIARARSYGMNCVFSRNGYRHAGLLIRNTNISGTIQSMNVWYKPIRTYIGRN